MTESRKKTGAIKVGISGWRYPGWRSVFYPKGLTQKNELSFASRKLSSIEINGTFYSMQRPELFASWDDETPDDFIFALKGPRFITHMKKLKEVRTPLANFFASGPLRLGKKLGPILWQLPPNFRFDAERIDAFLTMLPRDTEAASALARRHDDKLKSRAWLKIDTARPLRYAMEIRHESFRSVEFIALLRRHGVALACADSVSWPLLMDVTADFVYCRLHGSEQLYASGYEDDALEIWARRAIAWVKGEEPEDAQRASAAPPPKRARRDVFIYFDNDAKVRAPFDALALQAKLDQAMKQKG